MKMGVRMLGVVLQLFVPPRSSGLTFRHIVS